MPDENKLKAMAEAGYEIVDSCQTCTHSGFAGNTWGVCEAGDYSHSKHIGERRLPANRILKCGNFERDDLVVADLLGAYAAEPWKELK
jgi:hypothetical protein